MKSFFVVMLAVLVVFLSGCGSIEKGHFSWWGCSDPVRLANAELIRSEAAVRSAEADRYEKLAGRQDNILGELELARRGLPQEDKDGNPVQGGAEYNRQDARDDYVMVEGSLANITRLATGVVMNQTSETLRVEVRPEKGEAQIYMLSPYSSHTGYLPYGGRGLVIFAHPPTGITRSFPTGGSTGWTATATER